MDGAQVDGWLVAATFFSMAAALIFIVALFVLRQRLLDLEAMEIWTRSLADDLWERSQALRRDSVGQSGQTCTRHDPS